MVQESAFGRVLTEYRKRKGLSRSQLAEASGLSYPYVSQLETGLRKPSRRAGAQLAEALGIDPLALEAALPPADESSPSFERSLRAQAALLSGDDAAVARFGGLAEDPRGAVVDGMAATADGAGPPSRDEVVRRVVDLVQELDATLRLDALAEVQRRVMQGLLDAAT